MATDEQLQVVASIMTKLTLLGQELTFKEPISVGPLITTYRFLPKGVTKIKQIEALGQDIALALGVESVTIRRIPGENYIGFSVPNKVRTLVEWRSIVKSVYNVNKNEVKLPLLLGVDSMGKPFIDDLTKTTHLLVAGSTDTGKSVFLRSLLASLMSVRSPDEVGFILSDTKRVEFGGLSESPHLMFPPSKTVMETLDKMDWISEQVEKRLLKYEAARVQNIHQFNDTRIYPEDRDSFVVLVIDELADILSGEGKSESKIASTKLSRIVQKSRAAGTYVIASTQRPSVDVVAGSVKVNFPARLSFRLPSEADSRTVLGHGGAEHLLSRGDMYYSSPNRPGTLRLHSAYATNDDIQGCVGLSKQQFAKEGEAWWKTFERKR
jgi:DNA segregation ATPase FtsK/SpoIIIE, S-DNA-T family